MRCIGHANIHSEIDIYVTYAHCYIETVMTNMSSYVALCFGSLKDFEVCNELMKVQPSNTATSSDSMIAVLVKTDRVLVPHGVLPNRNN